MKSAEIRQAFLDYFASHQHQVVNSSSLIPANDPTLLFTNAGMVQFKDVFLGAEKRNYSRATSSQRCVRAGGKHNDLENVGYTARHHTFFEMLGNFSFGDYFKRDAINYAWKFLTDVLGLPEEKLWVTVHISDDEAADIWLKEVGVSAERFSRLDEDNFWQMGDTGPCGPSSEIFYDHGEHIAGGPPGGENDDLDRYIEIWNLVFMQYEKQPNGDLVPLPKPSVDTGMGLERMAAVLQNVHSNYEIDLFQALLKATASEVGCNDLEDKSLRVIADHIRSCAFLVCDGVLPSNEGRGYVLRRIIRRAVRHGNKLGQKQHFFYKLVGALCEQMGEAYPELVASKEQIERVLKAEEEQFAKTLDKGLAVLEARLAEAEGSVISGDLAFTLYDTFGFPVDLTNDIARERDLTLDLDTYNTLMAEQKRKSKEAGTFKVDYTKYVNAEGETEFSGYENVDGDAKVMALYRDGESVNSVTVGEKALVILDVTPFYAESGGQVGDTGLLTTDASHFEVVDCVKSGSNFLHIGSVTSGSITCGDRVSCQVNVQRRASITRNHSATHLLHAALRYLLGEHVAQKGSLNDEERLRFDFSHSEPVSAEQLQHISATVNQHIRGNSEVRTELCDMDTAMTKGAMALFGEKYGDEVRVVTMGDSDFSVELCGGTHVNNVGEIGLFYLQSESGVAAGVRRIEAVTGERAVAEIARLQRSHATLSAMLKSPAEKLEEKLDGLLAHTKALEKEVAQLKAKLASASADDWLNEAKQCDGYKLLLKTVEGADNKSLRDSIDKLRDKLGTGVVLLAGVQSGKIALIASVSKDLTGKIKAGDVVKHVATQIGGKGGGRPDLAQGGGTDTEALPKALASVDAWLAEV